MLTGNMSGTVGQGVAESGMWRAGGAEECVCEVMVCVMLANEDKQRGERGVRMGQGDPNNPRTTSGCPALPDKKGAQGMGPPGLENVGICVESRRVSVTYQVRTQV